MPRRNRDRLVKLVPILLVKLRQGRGLNVLSTVPTAAQK